MVSAYTENNPLFSICIAEMERCISASFTITGNLTFPRLCHHSNGFPEQGSTGELRYASARMFGILVELWEVIPNADASCPRTLQTDGSAASPSANMTQSICYVVYQGTVSHSSYKKSLGVLFLCIVRIAHIFKPWICHGCKYKGFHHFYVSKPSFHAAYQAWCKLWLCFSSLGLWKQLLHTMHKRYYKWENRILPASFSSNPISALQNARNWEQLVGVTTVEVFGLVTFWKAYKYCPA